MTCHCGNPMHPARDEKNRKIIVALACGCWQFVGKAKPHTEAKLPGLDPGPQHRQVKQRESILVEQIRKALYLSGFLVLRIGQWRADYAGNDKACPDLLIGLPGVTEWETCEVKLPGWTKSDCTPEQWELYQLGSLNIACTPEEALAIANAWKRSRARLALLTSER